MDINKQRLAIKNLVSTYSKKSDSDTDTSVNANIENSIHRDSSNSLVEPIAIVGLSGYLPGSNSVQEFWQSLDSDTSLIQEIPESRFSWKHIFREKSGNESYSSEPGMRCKWGGFIPSVSDFDSHFFKILPDEAELMDPQQRLLLMSVYHTLEDAGYAPSSLKGSNTGVFIGFERNEYLLNLMESGYDTGVNLAQSDSMIANNISYYFDFSGPSEMVNTMCSGAAVAIHRAVNALRSGEIKQAIVGASNLLLRADTFIKLSHSEQMSTTPVVKSFGFNADGYLRAEGVCSVMLKPYSAAVADGDAIYALIKNTAVNYNGKSSASIAAPNTTAHASLIQECYKKVGVDPRDVDYIEAQGMGNPVADICEWDAFNRALNSLATEQGVKLTPGHCKVSTLKPMAGHMHSASALAALFKVIRSLQTNKIHKIIGLEQINSDLDSDSVPCELLRDTLTWSKRNKPRLAGIHSYGAGGNNAHLLIEEVDVQVETNLAHSPSEGRTFAIPISAQNKKLFVSLLQELHELLSSNPVQIGNVAFTFQRGRDTHQYRKVFFANTLSQFLQQLEDELSEHSNTGVLDNADELLELNGITAEDKAAVAKWLETGMAKWPELPSSSQMRVHLPGMGFNCQSYWINAVNATAPDFTTRKVRRKSKPLRSEIAAGMTLSARSVSDKARVLNVLAQHLRILPTDIDVHREFSDMGFDSMLVSRLSRDLGNEYGTEFEPAVFFEVTTPAELIDYCNRIFSSGSQTENTQAYALERVLPETVYPDSVRNPIAIIGLAGKYPDAEDVNAFWQNLVDGKNSIKEIPSERWSVDVYFDSEANTSGYLSEPSIFKSNGKWGGFIEGLNQFDYEFFNLTPFEATYMSPKERLLMQCAWHALEDAGYTPKLLEHETVGVFVGISKAGFDNYKDSYFSAANRISYRFNFRGPSMPIDTACSSSLSAIHEACLHLQSGECSVALAGGVNAYTHPSTFAEFSRLNVLSKDGVLRAFDADANGFVPGEGVGTVLLKPLEDALSDGDHIYGVIRGSAVNHGGKVNGYTVPNPQAHARLIRCALSRAGLNARDISYVEAHGTGTVLGDPVEIRGLSEAYREDTADNQYCALGSVKTNIGHLEAAAGIAGLTKVLLQLKHQKIVPSLNVKTINPQIDFSSSPFVLQRTLADWTLTNSNSDLANRRRAAISSFGAGGSNAHIVVEEAPEPLVDDNLNTDANAVSCLFVLSAKSEQALEHYVDKYIDYLNQNTSVSLSNLTYTLQVGREAMKYRLACETDSVEMLIEKLTAYRQGRIPEKFCLGNVDKKRAISAFSEDHSAQELIRSWLEERKFGYVSELWTLGEDIDWPLGQTQMCKRISLPGYPFVANTIEKAPMLVPVDHKLKQSDEVSNLIQIESVAQNEASVYLMKPHWEVLSSKELTDVAEDGIKIRTIFCGYLQSAIPEQYDTLQSMQDSVAKRFEEYCIKLVDICTQITKSSNQNRTLIQVVVSNSEQCDFALPAISALLKTFSLENKQVIGQLIEMPDNLTPETIHHLLVQAETQSQRHWLKVEGEHLTALELELVEDTEVRYPWKSGGVYVITGGLGQLGFLCANDICTKSKAPVLILTGQKALDEGRAQKVSQLKQTGAIVHYEKLDLTDASAVNDLVSNVVREHGGINGVIHCAGTINDGFMQNKPVADIQRVLSPKTIGTWNLGESCEQVKLDFFVMFSSAVSLVGNVGQGDYAAANAFMDLYAHERQRRVAKGECYGKTRSIAWGLWQEGGMLVSEDILVALNKMSGMSPISSAKGLASLYQIIQGDQVSVVAIAGDKDKLWQHFNTSIGSAKYQEKTLSLDTNPASYQSNIRTAISEDTIRLSANILGVDASEVDLNAAFDELGIGLVELHALINNLNQQYDSDFVLDSSSQFGSLQEFIDAYFDALGHSGKEYLSRDNVEMVSTQLKEVIAKVTGYPIAKLHGGTGFDELGIDSLVIMNMTNELEKICGALPKTLFFEHQTIEQLSDYLALHHGAVFYQSSTVLSQSSDVKHAEIASLASNVASNVGMDQHQAVLLASSRKVVQEAKRIKEKDIAIIGLAGRYPNADNMDEFWQVLATGKDCISEIPTSRWEHSIYYDSEKGKSGKTYAKWGGFINGVDEFDPGFFNISPREAEIIEPQERLFLQTAYEAIEDAGYTRQALAQNAMLDDMPGVVGVYVGVTYQEYQLYGAQETILGTPMVLSMSPSSIANRVSYFCDFHGPSMAVDTMCASSLNTVHLACMGLLNAECKAAIAGGVNVSIHPAKYLMLGYGGFASSVGRCQTFSDKADGYVPGEGVGAVLLKTLDDALKDGDHIYGVIKGSAVNHGGRTYGYSVPNPVAQEAVIKRAIRNAEVNPKDISYLEAHGTGTSLGDPIEILALSKAFGKIEYADQSCSKRCAIGSVKSNIGHCESAAGIAGLTKVLLQMKHNQLVPSIHSETLNTKIDFDNSPFSVQKVLQSWDCGETRPKIAGISSFGAGGANAHVIVQEAPAHIKDVAIASLTSHAIVLTARSSEQLFQIATNLLQRIETGQLQSHDLIRMAYTLQIGRETFSNRLAFFATSFDELKKKLTLYVESKVKPAPNITWLDKSVCLGIADDANMQDVSTSELLSCMASDKNRLLELWVNGSAIQWEVLYGQAKPTKISLPTYPFARKRYWKPATNSMLQNKASGISFQAKNDLETVRQVSESIPEARQRELLTSDAMQKTNEIDLVSLKVMEQKTAADQASTIDTDLLHTTAVRTQIELVEPRIFAAEHEHNANVQQPVIQSTEPDNRKQSFESNVEQGLDNTDVLSLGDAEPVVDDSLLSEHDIKTFLRSSLADVLMLMPDEINNTMPFSDIGLDSIVGVEWIHSVNAKYHLNMATDVIHENPNINKFSLYMQSVMASESEQNNHGFNEVDTTHSEKVIANFAAEKSGADKTRPERLPIVIQLLANALLLDEAEIKANSKFVDLGLDSIVGVEWIQEINHTFGTRLNTDSVYDYSTPEEFCRYLDSQSGEEDRHEALVKVESVDSDTLSSCATSHRTSDTTKNDSTLTLKYLKSSLADVLMMEANEISDKTQFSDLGLDSITGLEWISGVNKGLGVSLDADVVYEHKTLMQLLGHIERKLTESGSKVLSVAKAGRTELENVFDIDATYQHLEEAF